MRTGTFTLGLSLAVMATWASASAQEVSPIGQSFAAPPEAREPLAGRGAQPIVAGARINRFVGIETESYQQASPDFSPGMQRDFERDRRPAAYGVAYMPLSPKAEVFARVGYGGSKTALQGPQEDSWKYGAGAQYNKNSRQGFRADYVRQGLPRKDIKANIFSFGLVRRF